MKNIDKIFSKLKGTEVEAPNVWNKLEAQLLNVPKPNSSSNIDKASTGKALTTNTILKTIGLFAGVGVIGVGAYLIVDSFDDIDKKEQIVKTQIESPKTNEESIKKNNEKTITFEKAKEINKPIANPNQNKEEIATTFKVSDESNIVLGNNNYSIKTINTNKSYQSDIKINYIQEDSIENTTKILPINTDIPDFKPSNVITPNGDGINDVFVIKDVDKFPDNCLIVFDRNGKSVYKCRGYQNNFNALNIPLGTYFYKFEYNNLGTRKVKTGSITVM